MRVWLCGEDDDGLCGELWAQEDTPEFCPECSFCLYHMAVDQGKEPRAAKPILQDFTLEEAQEADAIRVHVPTPIPLKLVQLNTLPRDTWVGRAVFHPLAQMGTRANWHRYEVGVVTAIEPDSDFKDMERCRYILADFNSQSDCLSYPPYNLWTPHGI